MKTITTTIAAWICFSISSFAGLGWTYQAKEGEDATSTHYYFYESNGDSIQRVRWVWNGGAQNPPTVTEYILGSGNITIRHLIGKREDVAALVAGRDAELELEEESSIAVESTAKMLVPDPPASSLSETQRIDLKNLIDLLAKERTPYETTEHQDGGQPATRSEEAKQALVVDAPDTWQVKFKGDEGFQFYSVTRKEGDQALLMFSRWPAPGNVNQIPGHLESMAKSYVEKAKADKNFKLMADEYKIEEIAGDTFSGRFVQFEIEGGISQTMFMIGDAEGIWNGQFMGTKERWTEALAILKKLKKRR